jgi:hypothetical protein
MTEDKTSEHDDEMEELDDDDESLDSPQEVFFEFVRQIDFQKPNVSVELTKEEMAQWDADDEEARAEFREAAVQELLAAADEQNASYSLIFDEKSRVLMVARFDTAEDGWLYLETEEDFRPKETEVFQPE